MPWGNSTLVELYTTPTLFWRFLYFKAEAWVDAVLGFQARNSGDEIKGGAKSRIFVYNLEAASMCIDCKANIHTDNNQTNHQFIMVLAIPHQKLQSPTTNRSVKLGRKFGPSQRKQRMNEKCGSTRSRRIYTIMNPVKAPNPNTIKTRFPSSGNPMT